MFALGIEFLTGTAVMTSAASREEAEWPPHPARIFMALVAAHYETRPAPEDGEAAAESWGLERSALEWLERQALPGIHCPLIPPQHRRTVTKVYVPVNDVGLPGKPESVKKKDLRSALGMMPPFRSRQERTFPAVPVGLNAPDCFVYLIWENAELPDELRSAIHGLAAKVIRVGHSSSLVRMWIPAPDSVPNALLHPVAHGSRTHEVHRLRSVATGFLSELESRFNSDEIDAFFALTDQIEGSTGRAKSDATKAFKERFGEPWKKGIAHPVRLRPSVGIAHAYATVEPKQSPVSGTVFDPELLILTKQEGRVFGLESTNLLVELLRGTLLTASGSAPEWFAGHQPNSRPSEKPHMAILPLSFVGTEYADGHILGFALAFPKSASPEERAEQLRRVLFDERGLERTLTLRTNSLGDWTLRREERSTPPVALRNETWTRPSSVWASVTPVVLDRHPKRDPRTERAAWQEETAAIVLESCRRIGLPSPIAIDIDKTSWHRGAPRSRPGPGGMPPLTRKDGSPRQQIHVHLQFREPVRGPVLLGAGRYRGYGVCKPL